MRYPRPVKTREISPPRLPPSEASAPRSPESGEADWRAAVRDARRGVNLEESFRTLDAHLRSRLLAYFRTRTGPAEDSEDLVQKTLTRVFQGIGGLEDEERFTPWLFVIARNVRRTAAAHGRIEASRRAGGEELIERIGESEGSREAAIRGPRHPEQEALLSEVRRAIEELPARQRQCLPLRLRDGLSYEEIARTLRLSVHTVRNHLAAARRALRRRLGVDFEKGQEGRT